MLLIQDLSVEVWGKVILRDVNLEIKAGETHVLFGPNGSGKSTLLGTLMGFERYHVQKGKIIFKDQDITHMPVNERALLGIGLSFQRPPTVRGLSMRDLLQLYAKRQEDIDLMAGAINFSDFLGRQVNEGFSGGELKRSELLQLIAQEADLILLDEPESGVDIENMALVGQTINQLLQKSSVPNNCKTIKQKKQERNKAGLIITHTGHILNYVNAETGHVLLNGHLTCSGNPRELLDCIQRVGYNECVRCAI